MIKKTMAYAKDHNGDLISFEVVNVETYDQAIQMVRTAHSLATVLCVVAKEEQ
jgi:hypothetical protein